MMLLTRLLSLLILLLSFFTLPGCDERKVAYVNPAEKASNKYTPLQEQAEVGLRLGIGSIITPKEGFVFYRQLVNYLEKELAMPVTVVDRGNYREFNDLLSEGKLDVAFVCGGPYVEGHEEFALELLVVPETLSGETVYYSDLIVPVGSTAKSLADLRGKRFAFTDPASNSGKLVPTYMLAKMGETPDDFFDEVIYTYAHDKSIQAVKNKEVDGAAVDSLIYDYLANKDPEIKNKTKVIVRSDPYGIPPVVVPQRIPETLRLKLQTVLLQMDKNPQGRSILEGMKLRRFVTSSDANYDTIREIRDFTRQQSKRQ